MKLIIKSLLASTVALSCFAATQAMPQPPQPMDPNPMARWGTSDASNIYVTGEVVWFKPINDNLAQYAKTDLAESDVFFQNQFQAGCRVALGYNTPFDGWDLQLVYTGLNYSYNNTVTWSDTTLVGNLSDWTGTWTQAYYFNQGDLDLGRMMKVSRKLKVRPHVGVRALWLTQKSSITPNLETQAEADAINKTSRIKGFLVGAELGLDSVWMLSREFGVYANLGFTTLVNQAKLVNSVSPLDTYDGNVSYKTNYGTKIVNGLDFALGLRWDRNFSNDDYHFGINFGYEHHSLINVNANAFTQNGYSLGFDSDFTMQGIALGARFDF